MTNCCFLQLVWFILYLFYYLCICLRPWFDIYWFRFNFWRHRFADSSRIDLPFFSYFVTNLFNISIKILLYYLYDLLFCNWSSFTRLSLHLFPLLNNISIHLRSTSSSRSYLRIADFIILWVYWFINIKFIKILRISQNFNVLRQFYVF
jgi:hypothetical protein